MNDDLFFMRHIIDEVRFLKTHCKGLPKDLILEDEVLRKAIQKSLENISVASFNLSPELKEKWNLIDWYKLSRMQVDMKTRFLSVDRDFIINVLKYDMPRLEKAAERIMETDFPGEMVVKGGGLKLP
jgi:uncharacterized protein with HEPN domain